MIFTEEIKVVRWELPQAPKSIPACMSTLWLHASFHPIIIVVILWFIPVSDTELLSPLEFPKRMIDVSLVMWMRGLWEAPRGGGWLPGKAAKWLEVCIFQFHLREERGAGAWISHQWPTIKSIKNVCNEASNKTQHLIHRDGKYRKKKKEMGFGELTGWWPLGDAGRVECCLERARAHHLLPIPCPGHLFHLAVPQLNPFKINQLSSRVKCLSSVSCLAH